MGTLKAILNFVKMLPEILKLLKVIDKNVYKAKEKKMTKEDIKKINKAFEENDEQALKDIFNS